MSVIWYDLPYMGKATLLLRTRDAAGDGFVEVVVWAVPRAIPPSTHGFKYRLAYVVNGERVLGYDNERGKGDHKHVAGREEPYQWRGVDALIDDFTRDVEDLI